MEEVSFQYKKKKVYIRLAMIIISLTIILAGIMTIQKNALSTIIIYIVCALLVVLFTVYKIVNIKAIAYFIKWDKKGVYTMESFAFCPWKQINAITLERYMGYQTLFFQIDETIETKMRAIHRKGKQYYCLPLADCQGKPSEILELINLAKDSK